MINRKRSRVLVLSMVAMWSLASIADASEPDAPRATPANQAAPRQDNPLLKAARQSDANPDSARKRAYQYRDPKQGWTPADPATFKPWVKPVPPAATPTSAKARVAPKP